jgi:hypothetical protein
VRIRRDGGARQSHSFMQASKANGISDPAPETFNGRR